MFVQLWYNQLADIPASCYTNAIQLPVNSSFDSVFVVLYFSNWGAMFVYIGPSSPW